MSTMIQFNTLPDLHILITQKRDQCVLNQSHDACVHTRLTMYSLLENHNYVTRANFFLTGTCPCLMKKQDNPSNTVNCRNIPGVPAWASGFEQDTFVFPMLRVTGSIPKFRKPKNFQKGRLQVFRSKLSSKLLR